MSSSTSTAASLALKLQGSKLAGKGFTSEVYDWGDGRVLKLFHNWVPTFRAEREHRVTKAVHAAGLPAPAVYDLVEMGDRRGIVFERIHGASMLSGVQARPWTLFKAVRQLAELHAQMHRCDAPLELPSQRDWIANGIEAAEDLSREAKEKALRQLQGLPEGNSVCHGDFHPENVLLTARGPVVIDWDSATRGHPLGDVACTSRLIQHASLPQWTPVYMHLLLKCSRALLHYFYLKRSLQLHAGTRQAVEAWQGPLAAAARSWRIPTIDPR
ncbi:MAG TPA: phosphotransferase [Candidatus Saccharimonadales bacterium]|nr:phosphotransferase [Candidatus Saccharimonadales bacterium]